jgi:uncharacterized protein YbjT (DUF2867 family)
MKKSTESTPAGRQQPVLVLGATGYIGGRLIPLLLAAGYFVRALARSPAKLKGRPWSSHPRLEIVRGDVFDRDFLLAAARGCRAAYYLIHSMNPKVADFAESDRRAAATMAEIAGKAGLKRLIYLSGLGDEEAGMSSHLRSRAEVARILGSGPVPLTVLRAAMIIGSGSASFEILRYLVDRLPAMVTPRWVSTPCQPIGVRNVLHYLTGCLEVPETAGETFDIGQEEIVTYRRLMEIYAEEAGLPKRLILPVPFLTPRLSSYWIHLVTPIPAALARPLAEGLSCPVVCQDFRIRDLIPQDLLDCRQAIRLALDRQQQQENETSWSDSGPLPPAEWAMAGDPGWAGGTVCDDSWRMVLDGTPEEIWPALAAIGGRTGWYYADWLWKLRGLLDRLVGGVGLVRGRRCPLDIRSGDALDFWRVIEAERPSLLLLASEMKLPGEAVLAFRLQPLADGGTEFQQIARYLPRGLLGLLYWYAVSPFHRLVFTGMLRGIAKATGKKIVTGPERMSTPK